MVRIAAHESGPNGMLRRFVIIFCLAFAGRLPVKSLFTNWGTLSACAASHHGIASDKQPIAHKRTSRIALISAQNNLIDAPRESLEA